MATNPKNAGSREFLHTIVAKMTDIQETMRELQEKHRQVMKDIERMNYVEGSSWGNRTSQCSETSNEVHLKRELELCKKEIELLRKELELLRREHALPNNTNATLPVTAACAGNITDQSTSSPNMCEPISIHEISALVGKFSGSDADGLKFSEWKAKVWSLRDLYKLDHTRTVILISSTLSGHASDWFISNTKDLFILRIEAIFDAMQERFNCPE